MQSQSDLTDEMEVHIISCLLTGSEIICMDLFPTIRERVARPSPSMGSGTQLGHSGHTELYADYRVQICTRMYVGVPAMGLLWPERRGCIIRLKC